MDSAKLKELAAQKQSRLREMMEQMLLEEKAVEATRRRENEKVEQFCRGLTVGDKVQAWRKPTLEECKMLDEMVRDDRVFDIWDERTWTDWEAYSRMHREKEKLEGFKLATVTAVAAPMFLRVRFDEFKEDPEKQFRCDVRYILPVGGKEALPDPPVEREKSVPESSCSIS